MSFTGKATFGAGANLPEIVDDVSDLVGIVSPFETPLLDAIGDPTREARSTYHEWLEDSLLANTDVLGDQDLFASDDMTSFVVQNPGRFRVNDQVNPEGTSEIMKVVSIGTTTIDVIRGYGNTPLEQLNVGQILRIIGPSAVEGDDCPEVRFTARQRKGNWTQIFTAGVEVSGSNLAASHIGLADEMDYQKQMRLRELLRDLENTVINGSMPDSTFEGSTTASRTMNGIIRQIDSNIIMAGTAGVPEGTTLTEEMLNYALRTIWEKSCGCVDLIVVGGAQKRQINSFLSGARVYGPKETTVRNMVNFYESDFGLCRVVLSRWLPKGQVLLLDSSRISVLPLAGRSMQFKPLASTGDYERGELIGEYTLEFRNEQAHGVIKGLD